MKHIVLYFFVVAALLACLAGPTIAQTPAKEDWIESFKCHDKNKDGVIDRTEFRDWMTDAFFHKDVNRKGYLVFEDVKDTMGAEAFKTADKNGDGRLSLQEFLDAVSQDFEACDRNKKGAITDQEIGDYINPASK